MAKKLLEIYPNEKEGILDKKLASLVNRKKCCEISKNFNLDNYLITGNIKSKKYKIEDKIISDFIDFIGDHPIVAHNTPFDQSFLEAMALRHKKELPKRKYYDTLTLSRAFLFFQPAHNLTAVSDFFGLSTKIRQRWLQTL